MKRVGTVNKQISKVIFDEIIGGFCIRVRLKKPRKKESKVFHTIFYFYYDEDFWPSGYKISEYKSSVLGLTLEEARFLRFSDEWDQYTRDFN
jgi:hypothetical protein